MRFLQGLVCAPSHLSREQEPCPQRLKPDSKQACYRSGEPLRHPKPGAQSFSASCKAKLRATRCRSVEKRCATPPKSGAAPSFQRTDRAGALGWRSGLPLRSRRSILTALAAEGLHPALSQVSLSYTSTLQEPTLVLFSPDSDECIDGMPNIPPSLGPGGHRNSSPISRRESRAPSLPEKKSRL